MFWQSVKKTWGGLLEERVEKSRDSPLAYLGCLKSHEISWDPFFHSPMKATRFWFRCPSVDFLSWSFSSDLAKMRPFPGLTIQKVSVSGTRAAKSVAGQEIYIVPQPFIEWLLIVTYDIDEAKSKQSDCMSVMGPTDRSHLGISMRNSPRHSDPIHHSDLTSRMYSVWLTLYFGEIRITFFLHLRTLAVRKGNLWGQMQWPGCLWGYISILWKESTAKKFARDLLLITSFPVFSQFRFYTSNSLTKQLRNSEKNHRFVAISTRLLDLQRASAALALWSLECVAVSVWWRAGHRRWRLSFTEFDGLAPWLFGDGCAWLFGGPCTIHT